MTAALRVSTAALRVVPLAGAGTVAGLTATALVAGVLPVLFAVAGSQVLGASAGPVRGPRLLVWFVVATGALLLREVLAQLQTALAELAARRIDGAVTARMMNAALAGPGLTPLTRPATVDALRIAARELEEGVRSPGQAGAAAVVLLARVVEWAGYCLCVAVAFAWWAGPVLAGVVLLFRHAQRYGLRRYAAARDALAGPEREIDYLRRLSVAPDAGKEIRVFGLGGWLHERLGAAYHAWLTPLWAARRAAYLAPFYRVTAVGVPAVALVLAALGATGGHLPATAFFLTVLATLGAVRLGEFYPEVDLQLTVGMRAYDAVGRFVRQAGDPAPAGSGPAPGVRDAIRFDGVSFAYPGRDRPVLNRLDLTLPAGRCTAIVGVNGAGKSTLIKLLSRLHDPDSGRILVDGMDLAGIDVAAWRRRIAVTFQDFARYETSAADNIGLGAADFLDDRAGIRAAAEAAGIAADLDRLPAGLDTPLAPHLTGGTGLSGGQWQRIALARAVFALRHGARVLVLDEPTASLDVRTEARFFDEFATLTRGATTVLVSHRFATVRHADHIVVLAEGRVAERGTHDELIARGGHYARMYGLQAARFDDRQVPA
ncbi:ABC transporter ATP-binding protein [Catenuloplanes indicus]|uniref:ATP-binding cassette subfamily B protein n=1 Tax=Catenuloplanes indicus TaxID=137267 RepID=A0AAE4B1V4_9ACTN|nr:ABC transporter ATP-binding protein [Catenuloplanes indicus]MDQ0371012.1 ATP-binding cassette subfamily B protein [Catenuloplanes indicus]